MRSKLTLLINEQIISDAKKYVRGHGKTLSKIVEEYLKSLTDNVSNKNNEMLLEIAQEL